MDGADPHPGPICSNCLAPLTGAARFCPACGAPVATHAERESRRTVTLLFTDVTGSTALGEALDPEAYRGVMTRYFTVAREAIERHGGTVEKFVGDAVLAVFGVPELREDDALRAVRAADELNHSLAALSRELERSHAVTLSVRTGVNTGPVVVGPARAGGAFATGDAVNTAARLEQAATPGTVLIGAQTYALVRRAVDAVAVEAVPAKGKTEPVPAYRLVGVRSPPGGRPLRWSTALVGRERETRALADALERTVAGSRAHLVTILGDPGIGKTRLVTEFLRTVGDRAEVVTGRCVSYGQGITYWPVAQVVLQALGLSGDEPTDVTREAIERTMEGTDASGDVADALLELLGRADVTVGREQVFWAVARLVESLASRRPLVMNVDDLHWAEPTLLELLEQVREETADLPLLLICQARPELLDTRPSWGGGTVNSLTLGLEPFTIDETGRSLTGLVGGQVPDGLVTEVSTWSSGNPLFVEELVTNLRESGLIDDSGAAVRLNGSLETAGVPPSLAALLAARLDRLPGAERLLLERVAVIGLEFRTGEALALTEEAATGVTNLLAGLVHRGLLRRLRSGPPDAWSFKHILVREAAYEGLPKALRAELHERFAEMLADGDLESTAGERPVFVAHHLEQAARWGHEVAPHTPGTAALTERAARSLAEAADLAQDREDAHTAAALLKRAVALPVSRPRLRELDVRLIEVLDDLGAVEESAAALRQFQEALDDGASELDHAFSTFQELMNRFHGAEDIDPASVEAAAARVEVLAREAGDMRRVVLALLGRQTLVLARTTWTELESITAQITMIGSISQARQAESILGTLYLSGPRTVTEYLDHIEHESRAWSTPSYVARARVARAIGHVARGDPGARAEAEAALDALPIRRPDDEGYVATQRSTIAELLGEPEAALSALRRSIAVKQAKGQLAIISTDLGTSAALMLELGRPLEEVQRVLDDADALTSPHDVLSVAVITAVRSVIAVRQGRQDHAAGLARDTVAVIDQGDDTWSQADIRRLVSEVAVARGDIPAARRLLEEALVRYRLKEFFVPARRIEQLLTALPSDPP